MHSRTDSSGINNNSLNNAGTNSSGNSVDVGNNLGSNSNNNNNSNLASMGSQRKYYSSYMTSTTTPTSSSPLLSSSNINIPSNLMSNSNPSSIYDNRSGILQTLPVDLFKVNWSEKEEREVSKTLKI